MTTINKPLDYFTSEDFESSREYLLNEIANRAKYFFRRADGSYSFPKCGGQAEQIIEMTIAASLKSN